MTPVPAVATCPRVVAPYQFAVSWWDGTRERTYTSREFETFGGAYKAAQRWMDGSAAPWREVAPMKGFRLFTHVDGTLRVYGAAA